MDEASPVSLALNQIDIPHRVFRHAGPVHSLEQAAQERGQRASQVVRSILFRLSEAEYLMVLVAGPKQISWKALRKHVGKSRVRMATEEEVFSVTGYRIGTVAPFGLPQPVRILIDEHILKEDEISIGSGVRGTGIIMASADLRRALPEAEVVSWIVEGGNIGESP